MYFLVLAIINIVAMINLMHMYSLRVGGVSSG